MYFLDTISGQSGETLVSAVLKYLLINSARFRDGFLKEIAQSYPPSRRPTFRNGIICRTEETVVGGRLDLLIEADNNLIAIENKLWAALQPDQPQKYIGHLETEASRRFGDPDGYRIVLIVPSLREAEVKAIRAPLHKPSYIVLTWSTICKKLCKLQGANDGAASIIAGFLHDHLIDHAEGSMAVGIPKDALVGPNALIKNQYQYDLLYRIRDLAPSAGKLAAGREHVGFSFRTTSDERAPSHWLGFVRSAEEPGCRLEVHTARLVGDTPTPLGAVDRGVSYAGGRIWSLDVPDQAALDRWQGLLIPIISTLDKSTDLPGPTPAE